MFFLPTNVSKKFQNVESIGTVRVIMNRNISWINYDNRLQIAPNILPDPYKWRKKVYDKDILAIKISLLNQGVRISSLGLRGSL